MPAVSVIMAVYNAGSTIEASVKSIMGQSFSDFEFIIVDDGSTDKTSAILQSLAAVDPRIRVLTQANTGLTIALNRAAAQAKGEVIARQDADDVSYPRRLEQQIMIMRAAPEVVLCGGNCDDIYADGFRGRWGAYAPEKLQRVVYFKTPFAHSTAMMRADIFRALGGYDESFKTAQDMELWMRFARKGRLSMVSEPVLARSVSSSSISARRRWRQFYDGLRARWRHNRGLGRIPALYYALRSLVVGLLPARIIRARQRRKAALS